jgi:guanosine-3',5'-bis(diphosphate) 3'-pyrophosphohydrolase
MQTTSLAQVGAVEDVVTLVAAVLDDTIEDTKTTPEEIEALRGEVRSVVEEVTDDKHLPRRIVAPADEHARWRRRRASRLRSRTRSATLDITHRPPATRRRRAAASTSTGPSRW